MIAMMDSLGMRLEGDRRRTALGGAMAGSRRGTLRRPVGLWLLQVGLRLAPEMGVRPMVRHRS